MTWNPTSCIIWSIIKHNWLQGESLIRFTYQADSLTMFLKNVYLSSRLMRMSPIKCDYDKKCGICKRGQKERRGSEERGGRRWYLTSDENCFDHCEYFFLFNMISVVTVLVNACCSYAPGSETHTKRFKNTIFSLKYAITISLSSPC